VRADRRKTPAEPAEEVHRAAVEEVQEWRRCLQAHTQEHCVRLYHPQQLVKGMYSEFIEVCSAGLLPHLTAMFATTPSLQHTVCLPGLH
jgi:hypothetical protein